MSKKTGEFQIKIQGIKGETPAQTMARAEQAIANIKVLTERREELESNPLIQEWKTLNDASTSKSVAKKRAPSKKKKDAKTKPRGGKIEKKKRVPKKKDKTGVRRIKNVPKAAATKPIFFVS